MSDLDDLEELATRDGRMPFRRKPYHEASKMHCCHGHPFDKENTEMRNRKGRWHRVCKTCQREERVRRWAAKKAAGITPKS